MNRTEHLLACLAEECHEIGQRALKAQRFGLLEIQPEQELTNWHRLQQELADLLAVMEMLEGPAGCLYCIPRNLIEAKKAKVEKYMVYAESQGALRPHSDEQARECAELIEKGIRVSFRMQGTSDSSTQAFITALSALIKPFLTNARLAEAEWWAERTSMWQRECRERIASLRQAAGEEG